MKLVECVPNFSEGRRKEVIDAIADAVRSVEGVRLLDVESDPNHNRCVVSFVGSPEAVKAAALASAAKAVELIDMNRHKGEHPRLGAVDVIPFIPISGIELKECVELAHAAGKELWERLKLPVYFYEDAALRPERRNLADVRKGEYEGLKNDIVKPERHPDVGEAALHPTAGAVVVGARGPLVAFNVNLGTDNLDTAKRIAKAVRAKDGGFAFVKALGFELKDRGIVQVSMNMINFRGTPLFRVYETIKNEAERYGVPVVGTEIVGLVPLDALLDCADHYLRLEKFKREQVLEVRLWE